MIVLGVAAGGLLSFCVGDTQGTPGDAGGDTTVSDAGNDAPPAQGFTLSLAPSHVTADPGDPAATVTINVVRAASFTDDVSFTIVTPAHVTATVAPDTGNGGTSSSFTVSVDGTAPLGDVVVSVTGQNPTKTFVENTSLGIRVGSLFDIGDGGFVVPSYANALIVKAWGAGGGAGCTTCSSDAGVSGGGGGFASATVPVSPGASLVAFVGTGGPSGFGAACGSSNYVGGAGGGFTALQVKGGNYLIIAGAGGGASFAFYTTVTGGAGGGAFGQDGTGECQGSGGTQTQGGASSDAGDAGVQPCVTPGASGTLYQGGAGYNDGGCLAPDAGFPGGGRGGFGIIGAGGGGGGYYGGGGAGGNLTYGGGGGGSGWLSVDAGALITGNNATAANTSDPDYARCAAGAGAGGVAGVGVGGSGGCLVIRLPKP